MHLLKPLRYPKKIRQISQIRLDKQNSTDKSSTIDDEEVKHFKEQSLEWWKPGGQMTPLYAMNRLRVPFIRDGFINTGHVPAHLRRTSKPLNGIKILDVGCGGGFLAEPLVRLGAQVVGLDATKALIKIAEEHKALDPALKDNLVYIHDSIESFASSNQEKFDGVVSSEVLEHITMKKEFIKNCVLALKPEGSIFITTMSQTLKSKLGIFFSEYVMNIVPPGTHDYKKMVSPHELQSILQEYNCTTTRIHGMAYNPITSTWFWIKNTDINYALHAIKNKPTV